VIARAPASLFLRYVAEEYVFHASECFSDILSGAVEPAERGLIAADLGGGLINQRVARPGKAKSAGFRTIIACRSGQRAFFVFGFAKNDRHNLSTTDERGLKDSARLLIALSERGIETMLNGNERTEVRYEEES
jgi:hypothetical protein